MERLPEFPISNIMTQKATYQFLSNQADLSWREISFGLQKGYILQEVAVDKALAELGRSRSASTEVAVLAGEHVASRVVAMVERLAASEPPIGLPVVRQKWLYLWLAWLYEIRDSLEDPLGEVESAYADFGFPEEIAHFIRYMPMCGPDLGSREKNIARLNQSWHAYVESARRRYLDSR